MDNLKIKKTQTLVLMGLYAALVTGVTISTSVQYGAGGYFNLGDVVVLLLASITPFTQAVVAASVGSMIADLLVGAAYYTVFTGIIKALMVFAVFSCRKFLNTKFYFIAFILSSTIMLVGYGIVDGFVLGGYSFLASCLANLPQAIIGSVLSIAMFPFTKKIRLYLKG